MTIFVLFLFFIICLRMHHLFGYGVEIFYGDEIKFTGGDLIIWRGKNY